MFYLFLPQIIFEATRGSGYQGDIALDDVYFQAGACPTIVDPTDAPPQGKLFINPLLSVLILNFNCKC